MSRELLGGAKQPLEKFELASKQLTEMIRVGGDGA
jgi:hypothetical protein